MKRINTSYVSDPTIQQPLTTKSLDFLQDGILEITNGIIKNMIQSRGFIYSASVPYLVAYGTGIYDRYYFFDGELYRATGVNNLPYAHINTSADAVADPLLFSDNVNRDVHNNRYLTFNVLPTGALFALADVIDIVTTTNDELTLATQTTTSGTYVDMTGLTFTTPNDGISRKYKLSVKGDAELSAASGTSAGVGGKVKITDGAGTTDYDISRLELTVIFPSGSGDVVGCLPINCKTIQTLAPNTTVKCQFLNDADGITVKNVKFFIEQC